MHVAGSEDRVGDRAEDGDATALPSDRANMLLPVTTPRSFQPTLDWAAIRVGTASRPMPPPITRHTAATTATFGRCAAAASTAEPAITSAAPNMAVFLNPHLRYNLPARLAVAGHPSVNAARARPAITGWTRSEPSRNVGT